MRFRLVALFLSVCLSIAGLGAGSAAAQDAAAVARAHLAADPAAAGLTGSEVGEMVVADIVPGPPGLEIVYLQQRHAGLDVHNALATVAVKGEEVLYVSDSLVAGVPAAARGQAAVLSDVEAAQAAARTLGLEVTEAFSPSGVPEGFAARRELSDGGISRDPIPVELVWQRDAKDGVRLAWMLVIDEVAGENWWDIRIDARTGAELDRINWVVHEDVPGAVHDHGEGAAAADVEAATGEAIPAHTPTAVEPSALTAGLVDGSSYHVLDAPAESPNHGSRSVVSEPAWAGASPFGWHDTDGVDGAEFTTTQGNNVHAYTDVNDDNAADAGSSPDGGAGLVFDFPLDLTQPPSGYRPAAVTNLFYWNNLIHDTFYRYGFDEASGNFQANNYGNGGTGTDHVRAEAQDGAEVGKANNANFAAPPDGTSGRMQMFIWTPSTPDRDGDLDNGIIVHEYGHGISIRLTGGPANSSCLNNAEQGGEGWSDWFALMMTIEPGDDGPDSRGIGTYALNQPTTGPGIRAFPYSTDMTVDPRTYDDIVTSAVPHGVGSVWAAMLWDVTWALIDQHGFDPDLITGDQGNAIALHLITDGLKLQPCSPGFVDARDAIIAADVASNGGENVCLLWDAFAKRGLGASATQGSSGSIADGVEAFDTPMDCLDLHLIKTASPDGTVGDNSRLTYSLEAVNASGGPLADVVVTDPIPTGTTYIPGSATCGGTLAGGVVTFDIGTIPLGGSATCTFVVITDDGAFTEIMFEDGFDVGPLQWTASGGPPTWAVVQNQPNSAPNVVFATDPAVVTDQRLTLNTPVPVVANSVLQFWHRYDTELNFDGGVVEISTDDGATWVDLGPDMTVNGYNGTISNSFGNPLGGRQAFTGNSGTGYMQTTVDLSAYVGQDILARFRLGTDDSVADQGWWVDDVTIGTDVRVSNTATATGTGVLTVESTVETIVVERLAPDLTVSALADPPATAEPGDSFTATDTTANSGGDAVASQTRYYLSTDASPSAGDVLLTGARGVPLLPAGAASASGRSVTIPTSTPDATYRLIACADDTDLLTESDEGNNCRTATGSIDIEAPEPEPDPLEPDLVVSDLDDVPAAAAVGSSFEVTETTANSGDGPAGTSRTRFYLSADASIDGDDERLSGSRSIASLDAGDDSTGEVSLTVPDDVAIGTYRLIACADDLDVVDESDEGNNCRASAATDSVQITPAFVADDGSLTIIDPSPDTAGNSRVAIEFAQHTIPDAAAFAQTGSGEVLLASEAVFADALASGALQGDRPLLLNDPEVLEPEVLAEIQRLGATTVRIIGGDLAVGPAVQQALTTAGLQVVRTFGPTRLETARAIADLVPADGAFLARAFPLPTATDQTQAFADTLALGGWAAASGQPIYLTQTELLSGSTTTALTARGAQQLHVIGGTAAISDPTQVAAAALVGAIDRVAGPNRFATATAIAAGRGVSATAPVDTIIVIEGQAAGSWAAGFSSALLSAQTDAPVVLVNGELIPDETRAVLDTMVNDAPDVICSASTTVCTAVGQLLGVAE